MANELEEAIFFSIIKRSGGGASELLAFIRRLRTRQRFHDKSELMMLFFLVFFSMAGNDSTANRRACIALDSRIFFEVFFN